MWCFEVGRSRDGLPKDYYGSKLVSLSIGTAQCLFGTDRRTYHSHQQCGRCSRETDHWPLCWGCSTVCCICISRNLIFSTVFQNFWCKYSLSLLDFKGLPSFDVKEKIWPYCTRSFTTVFSLLVTSTISRYPCPLRSVWLALPRWVSHGMNICLAFC